MSEREGKCPECGKTYHFRRMNEIIVCDCWRYCPMCGAEMQSFTPDLTPKTYGLDGRRELQIMMVCTRHLPPFFSKEKPAEVVCT